MLLYTIILPALIVLSLVGIIIFLMKKAPEVANINESPLLGEGEKEKSKQEISRGQFKWRKEIGIAQNVVGKTGRIKDMFVRTKSHLFSFNQAIQERRKNKEEKKEDVFLESEDREEEYALLKKEISQEVSSVKQESKAKPEKKDLFEKILIERIAANPKDIEAYERLGEYYLDIENWNYAKECFKQVIKLSPGSIKARMKMRKLERLLGK